MKNKFKFNIVYLIVLAILIRLVIGFFLAKEIELQTGMDECDSAANAVASEPITNDIHINIYGNAPSSPSGVQPENKPISILPIWIVDTKATWTSNGTPSENKCRVIINALTGDVIRVDFPVIE